MKEEEVNNKWDCFLSHCWGTKQNNFFTHFQVKEISEILKSNGIKVWIDDKELNDDLITQMINGIDNSSTFIAFLTQTYLNKSMIKSINAGKEYNYAANLDVSNKIIPVVLDPKLLDIKQWHGTAVGFDLGELYTLIFQHL